MPGKGSFALGIKIRLERKKNEHARSIKEKNQPLATLIKKKSKRSGGESRQFRGQKENGKTTVVNDEAQEGGRGRSTTNLSEKIGRKKKKKDLIFYRTVREEGAFLPRNGRKGEKKYRSRMD